MLGVDAQRMTKLCERAADLRAEFRFSQKFFATSMLQRLSAGSITVPRLDALQTLSQHGALWLLVLFLHNTFSSLHALDFLLDVHIYYETD